MRLLASAIGTAFRGNTKISILVVFKYFTNIKKFDYNNRFNGCTNLSVILFPKSLTSLGGNLFTSCSKCKTIICELQNEVPLDTQTFRGLPSYGTLYVPSGCTGNFPTWMNNSSYNLGVYHWNITDNEYSG